MGARDDSAIETDCLHTAYVAGIKMQPRGALMSDIYSKVADASRLSLVKAGIMPLIPQLNAAVMTMANATNPTGWDVGSWPEAAHSLDDLNQMIVMQGRIVVWSGASETTIFACPEHNHAFRAWHDAVHYDLQAPFTIAGEAAVVFAQVGQLVRRYGADAHVIEWSARILSEVIGQAIHEVQVGDFPADQVQFSIEDTPKWFRLANVLVGEFATAGAGLTPNIIRNLAKRLAAEAFGAY